MIRYLLDTNAAGDLIEKRAAITECAKIGELDRVTFWVKLTGLGEAVQRRTNCATEEGC